jgi:hypothetical protein
MLVSHAYDVTVQCIETLRFRKRAEKTTDYECSGGLMELQILTGHTVHIKHTVEADSESTAASLIRTPQRHWVLMQIQLSPHTLFLSNATHTSRGKQGNTNIRMKDTEDYGVV